MQKASSYDPRLSELIWRFIKLRTAILLFCILALLTSWSSLEVGNRKAPVIDNDYCLKVAEDAQNLVALTIHGLLKEHPTNGMAEPQILPASDFCKNLGDTRYWLLSERAEISHDTKYFKSFESPDEQALQVSIARSLFDYESKRSEAFRLGFRLTSGYSENEVEANALSIAAALPFVVLGFLLLYFMLGQQEARLVAQLQKEMENAAATGTVSADLFAAQSQYFVTPREPGRLPRLTGFIRCPDKFAKTSLFVCTVFLLSIVIGEFASDVSGFTDTMFTGYPFWLYTVTFFAAMAVVTSRRFVAPTEPETDHSRIIVEESTRTDPGAKSKLRRLVARLWVPTIVCLAGAAFVSMITPWAARDLKIGPLGTIYGYQWLLPHSPGSRLLPYRWLALDPVVFLEIKIEVLLALTFCLLCVLRALKYPRRKAWLSSALHRTCNVGAVLVLYLSIGYLVFMGTLEYESQTFYNMYFESLGSMLDYSPLFGYWLFTFSCTTISVLTLSGLEPRK